MIYLVTLNQELFNNDAYKIISVDESLHLLSKYNMLQADSETDGRDAHINKLLLFQLGSIDKDFQIVLCHSFFPKESCRRPIVWRQYHYPFRCCGLQIRGLLSPYH